MSIVNVQQGLSQNQLTYVLDHFEMCWTVTEDYRSIIEYGNLSMGELSKLSVPYSSSKFDQTLISEADGAFIFYPIDESNSHYEITGERLLFTHDIFRAIFFILSGQFELGIDERDPYGRIPYASTLLASLKCIHRPIVNELYDVFAKGLKVILPEGSVSRKRLSDSFVFLLSHDIDVVSKFNHYLLRSKLKKFDFTYVMQWIRHWLTTEDKRLLRDPYWTFDLLCQLNEQYDFHSTYFFLPKGDGAIDARYDVKSTRLRNVIAELVDRGDEVQLHGTVKSHLDLSEFSRNVNVMNEITGREVFGVRQHRLCFSNENTPRIHATAGMRYDATIGFAEHEGWRRGFCFPSRFYDHTHDRSYAHWSIPLTVMDTTLYHYQKYDIDTAIESFSSLVRNVENYGGLISLLWHNSSLDEGAIKGINRLYGSLLKLVSEENAESLTYSSLLNRVYES